MSTKHVPRTVATVLIGVALFMVLAWMFNALGSFLFLLLLAWLLSIAMEPPVLWLVRHGWKRWVATFTVTMGIIVVTLGLIAAFGQVFVSQLLDLKDTLPDAVTHAVDWMNTTFHTNFNVEEINKNLQLTPEKIGQLAQQFGGGLLGVFGSVMTAIFGAVTILVFAYYLSADSVALRQTIGSYLPVRYQPVLVTVWEMAVEKTGGYVVSKTILAGLSSICYSTFFFFIQVPFWLPLGIFAGIAAQFVPVIGTYFGVLIPGLFAVLQRPISGLYILIFATIYQQIESYVFTPRVSQKTMDIHPAVALASVFIGVALFGPIGALIGIPLVAVVIAIIETFRHRHELVPELAELQERDDNDGDNEGGDGEGSDEEDDPGAEESPVSLSSKD